MSTPRSERITQVSVVIIAVCAVVVSIWQGQISQKGLALAREHNRLTVKPYLDITRFTDSNDQTLEVKIVNHGYGPAIINEFSLIYDNQTYDNWNQVLNAAQEGRNIRFLNNMAPGSVMASGLDNVLVRLQTAFEHKGITIRIGYESIYEEKDSIEFTF